MLLIQTAIYDAPDTEVIYGAPDQAYSRCRIRQIAYAFGSIIPQHAPLYAD